jgi:NADPH:quinone reductase-like Zn-dependent oxidoreductase
MSRDGFANTGLCESGAVVTTSLDWVHLAAIPETFYTAFGIYQSLRLQSNDRVLIRAATSGVGVAVLKLMRASELALSITGTTRSDRKDAALKALGIDTVLHTTDANHLGSDVGEFDKIINLIGPFAVRDSLAHLAEFGVESATGELGGVWTLDGFDPIMDIPNNRYLSGFYSGDVDAQRVQTLFDFITTHHVDTAPEKVFTLAQTRAAHEYLAISAGLGKVVVLP